MLGEAGVGAGEAEGVWGCSRKLGKLGAGDVEAERMGEKR